MNASRLLALVVILSLPAGVRADLVVLKDGTVREGEIVRENAEAVVLELQRGALRGSVTIPRQEILSVERKALPPDTAALEGRALKKAAEGQTVPAKAAQAWLQLGNFYADHTGFAGFAKAAFERVLLFEPDNAEARAKLGFVPAAQGWKMLEPKKIEPVAEPALAAQKAPPAAPEDEFTIGLRRDAETIRKLLQQQAARLNPPLPPPPPPPAPDLGIDDDGCFGYGYNAVLYGNGVYYYSPGAFFYFPSCTSYSSRWGTSWGGHGNGWGGWGGGSHGGHGGHGPDGGGHHGH